MEFNRITQKTETETVLSDAHVLITQQESVDDAKTEALRRATLDAVIETMLRSVGFAVLDERLCAILSDE